MLAPLQRATDRPPGEADRIAQWTEGFSIEATRPGDGDLAALAAALRPRTAVYLSAVPGRPADEQVQHAAKLRALGLEPVPHLAARAIESPKTLESHLARLNAEAGVRRVLVVAGDRDRPAGPFGTALDVIDSGLLQRHGISEAGVAGYPQGHPRIAEEVLARALAAKIDAAGQTGLGLHIVTQFCFDAAAVTGWTARLRDLGIEHTVRVGMAGPASLTALLRYARRCGVQASAQGLARNAGLAKHLVGTGAPDALIRALAEACGSGRLGRVEPHLYSFGGPGATARWAAAVADGRIAPDRSGGFAVLPP